MFNASGRLEMNTNFELKKLKISSSGDLEHKQDEGNQRTLKKWYEVISM